jgi:hypothetical protein
MLKTKRMEIVRHTPISMEEALWKLRIIRLNQIAEVPLRIINTI